MHDSVHMAQPPVSSDTFRRLLRFIQNDVNPKLQSAGQTPVAHDGALDDGFEQGDASEPHGSVLKNAPLVDSELGKKPTFRLPLGTSRELGASMTARGTPTSLMTERLHDGDANCIERATQWAGKDQNVVFLRDGANLDGDNAGHALIRDTGTGRVWDPNDGPPPADASSWKYGSVDEWRQAQAERPGGHGQYTVDAEIPAGSVKRLLATEPGAARDAELAAIRRDNPAVGDKLARVATNRYATIVPENVAAEMVGQKFSLTRATEIGGRTLPAGSELTVTAWDNASPTVTVRDGSRTIEVPKALLRPVAPESTLTPYRAGIDAQARAVQAGERDLEEWLKKEPEYRRFNNMETFEAERARLQQRLTTRREVLNRKLIQETMFNRHDPAIERAVAEANRQRGLTGQAALDPNVVKSMLFQESQLGTAGQHLELPGDPNYHPVRSRFNLGQVIDSSGLAMLTHFERDRPELAARFPDLRKDLSTAQQRRETLLGKGRRTATEESELRRLNQQRGAGNWEPFIWQYSDAASPTRTFGSTITDYFNETTPPRYDQYDFWIERSVDWLFEKHRPGQSWSDTVRRYNGGGARARNYANEVMGRVEAARRAGGSYVPDRI